MAKTESKMMGARLPAEWVEQIESIALDEGVTTAEICRRAFGKFLGKRSAEGGGLASRVRRLERQFAALTAQILADDS